MNTIGTKLNYLLVAFTVLVVVTLACGTSTPTSVPKESRELTETTSSEILPSKTTAQTNTLAPTTDTPAPTDTPKPTNTPLPPTETPNPNKLKPGTYIVGTDIQPGIYRGEAGKDIFESCYWARLKDVLGSIDSIISGDNSIGQFYIEVRDSDYALETNCELVPLSTLPEPSGEPPLIIKPGMYIVDRDIRPGTYKGQAGADIMESCYWARLKDFSGEIDSIIAGDNAIGQFYVQVLESDFGLTTGCELEWVEVK